MSEITRKQAIEQLKQILLDYTEFWEDQDTEGAIALRFAINSLEVVEAYNRMYKELRPATSEEREEMNKHLREISTDTGVNIFDLIDGKNKEPTPSITLAELKEIREEIENMLSDGFIHKKTAVGIIDKKISELEGKEPTKQCDTCRNKGSHNGVCDICHSCRPYGCWTPIGGWK